MEFNNLLKHDFKTQILSSCVYPVTALSGSTIFSELSVVFFLQLVVEGFNKFKQRFNSLLTLAIKLTLFPPDLYLLTEKIIL